jgi:hypothetical protein
MNDKTNYILCKSFGYRVHLEICKKCTKRGCSVNKERLKEAKRKEEERLKKKREKSLKRKIKKLETSDINRSLLLKPEDRIDNI